GINAVRQLRLRTSNTSSRTATDLRIFAAPRITRSVARMTGKPPGPRLVIVPMLRCNAANMPTRPTKTKSAPTRTSFCPRDCIIDPFLPASVANALLLLLAAPDADREFHSGEQLISSSPDHINCSLIGHGNVFLRHDVFPCSYLADIALL